MRVDIFIENYAKARAPGSRNVTEYTVEMEPTADLATIYSVAGPMIGRTLNAMANVVNVQTDLGCFTPSDGKVYLRASPVYKTWEEMESEE